MRGTFVTLLAGAFLSTTAAAFAGDSIAAVAIAPASAPAAPPVIDGSIDAQAWKNATVIPLKYDGKQHTVAAEPTTAMVMADDKFIYVAFTATQTRTPISTSQRTNNVGVDLDDEVKVALWPNATQGFSYQFISTPIGTKYQVSSENQNYEPQWDAAGKIDGDHYTVTMRIPLSALHSQSANNWFIQLTRWEPKTDSLYIANGGPNVQGTGDFNYAMPLHGITAHVERPKPRIGAYALGAVGAPSAGGSTSRAGADISIPITNGTSLIATVHPDFSNVEADQQSISPTAYQRYYSELRPFFAQGANFYNYMECDACPYEQSLYTPAIPTPRTGYAIEGQQGQFSFGGFDAVGVSRVDMAQSVTFRNRPRNWYISTQHVGVDMPGFRDNTTQVTTKLDDLQHKFVYANYGVDSGTNVTDPRNNKFYEVGGGYYTPDIFTGGGIRKIGAQYSPYDGFVPVTDLAGWSLFTRRQYHPAHGILKSWTYSGNIDRYHGAPGPDMSDNGIGLDFVSRSLWEFSTQTGSSYAYVNNVYMPLTQNTTQLTYRSGTSTPTSIAFSTGAFGDGRLNTWTRVTNFKVGPLTTLTLELDDTRQHLNNGTANIQWLERASVAYQMTSDSSFAIGLRRFNGSLPTPNGGGCFGLCSNVSFAYHKRAGKRELYIAYGNPGTLYTTPQFLMKIIDYVGADKGT